MDKEQLAKQLNTGEYLIWAINRIKELESEVNRLQEATKEGTVTTLNKSGIINH